MKSGRRGKPGGLFFWFRLSRQFFQSTRQNEGVADAKATFQDRLKALGKYHLTLQYTPPNQQVKHAQKIYRQRQSQP